MHTCLYAFYLVLDELCIVITPPAVASVMRVCADGSGSMNIVRDCNTDGKTQRSCRVYTGNINCVYVCNTDLCNNQDGAPLFLAPSSGVLAAGLAATALALRGLATAA